MRALAGLAAAALLGGCYKVKSPESTGPSSFLVLVDHVYQAGTRTPVNVVKTCADRHGGVQANVPEAERGTLECPYVISNAPVDFEVFVVAKDLKGETVVSFNGPVALRSVPGDLALSYQY